MFVSQTVLGFLDHVGVDFDLVSHPHVFTTERAASTAHVPLDQLAKAVLFHDADELLLAVVPASHQVNPWAVAELTDSPLLALVEEDELAYVFRDCERGAVPAIGAAFGVRSIVDDQLLKEPDIYFEAGDHERLVHVRGSQFARLMEGELHGWIRC